MRRADNIPGLQDYLLKIHPDNDPDWDEKSMVCTVDLVCRWAMMFHILNVSMEEQGGEIPYIVLTYTGWKVGYIVLEAPCLSQ